MFEHSRKRRQLSTNVVNFTTARKVAHSAFDGAAATDIHSKNYEIPSTPITVGGKEPAPDRPSGQESLDLSFFKVLVAEDNLINQKIFQKMLQKMNIRFKIVGTGSEVIEVLRNEYFDLVLMDCYMPQMSGFEAALMIRSSEEYFAKIPLIAFSAGVYDYDLKASREAGMDDFLLKPVTFEQLRAKLSHWAHKVYENLSVLDAQTMKKIRVFDDQHQTLLRSLYQIYSENTQEELYKLRDLVQDGTIDLIRKKAHMLKSSAAQLGAFRFEKFCILMEQEELLDIERAKILYVRMCEEYEKSRLQFYEYCQNLSQI